MKKYTQLVQELPSKKVIMAFGRFQPPSIGHELLINFVKKIAQKQDADYSIFVSKTQDKKTNPLHIDRKMHYLKKMFPNTNFIAANENMINFIQAANSLSKKYKHLVMIAGSDRVPEYKRMLEKYNGTDAFSFETIEVVSAGERDPDSDAVSGMSGTKMRESAKNGDYQTFKKGLPKTFTDVDGKLLMNEIRNGLGLKTIKENISFERSEIREKFRANEIFNIGDKVTDGEYVYEIVDRGANYLTVVNESGCISKKWLDSVKPTQVVEDIQSGQVPEEISFKGYTTKNLHHSEDAIRAFHTTIQRYNDGKIKDAVAILNALKATDAYMKINDIHLESGKMPDQNELSQWHMAHDKARDSLNRIGEFMHHFDYWHMHEHEIQDLENNFTVQTQGAEFADSVELKGALTEMKYSSADRVKVARVIATALGLENAEKISNPEQLVNDSLRKIKNKAMRAEYINVLHNMLQTAKEAGINYDEKLVPRKVEESTRIDELSTDTLARYKKAASADASAADKKGDFNRGNKRFSGIIKATNKQFANSKKQYTKEETDQINDLLEQIATAKILNKDTHELQRKLSSLRFTPEVKDNESGVDAEKGQIKQEPNQVGHSMIAPDESHHLRRMKVQYRTESVNSEMEKASKEAAEANLKAKHAKQKEQLAKTQAAETERLKEESTTEDDFDELEDKKTVGLTKTAMGEETDSDELQDELNVSDEELDKIVDNLSDDNILDAYEDEELSIVDDDTGEHVSDLKEETLNEVLSRMERIKAKVRFARTQSKRERKLKIALKARSSSKVINKRARRLAIEAMKKRIAKRPLDTLSVAEKERIEAIVQRRKAVINRLAMKMVPKIRKIENDRLSHKVYTK